MDDFDCEEATVRLPGDDDRQITLRYLGYPEQDTGAYIVTWEQYIWTESGEELTAVELDTDVWFNGKRFSVMDYVWERGVR